MGSNGYRRLTREDLRAFDNRMRDMVLRAMEVPGAVGRISSKGHAVLKGPGGTCTIQKTADNRARGRYNAEQSFKHAFPGVDPWTAPVKDRPTEKEKIEEALVNVHHMEPTLECPVKKCEAVFVTEGARYDHIEKQHWKCMEIDPATGNICGYIAESRQRGGNGHLAMKHPAPGHEPPYLVGARARKGLTEEEYKRQQKRKAAAKKAAATRAKNKAKPMDPAVIEASRAPSESRATGALIAPPDASPAEMRLARIRAILGEDPRVAALEAKVHELTVALDEATKHAADLEAKLALLKEALDA